MCGDGGAALNIYDDDLAVGGDQYRHDFDPIKIAARSERGNELNRSFADDILRLLVLTQADEQRWLKSLSLRDRRWTTPSRLNAIARYPSSFSSYSHCGLSGSESVRSNSIGWMKPTEEVRVAGFRAEVALVLRSISPMKNQSTDDTAQPTLQRDPDEWKTGDEPMTDAQHS